MPPQYVPGLSVRVTLSMMRSVSTQLPTAGSGRPARGSSKLGQSTTGSVVKFDASPSTPPTEQIRSESRIAPSLAVRPLAFAEFEKTAQSLPVSLASLSRAIVPLAPGSSPRTQMLGRPATLATASTVIFLVPKPNRSPKCDSTVSVAVTRTASGSVDTVVEMVTLLEPAFGP